MPKMVNQIPQGTDLSAWSRSLAIELSRAGLSIDADGNPWHDIEKMAAIIRSKAIPACPKDELWGNKSMAFQLGWNTAKEKTDSHSANYDPTFDPNIPPFGSFSDPVKQAPDYVRGANEYLAQPIDAFPDLLIKCSCGKSCAIRWDGTKYIAASPRWKYHVDPDNDLNSGLWHCGTPGHHGSLVKSRARNGFRLYRGGSRGPSPEVSGNDIADEIEAERESR